MENGSWFIQAFNAENRLSVVQKLTTGNCSAPGTFAAQWNFSYDGDGTRVTQSYTAYDSNGNPGTPVLTEYFMGGLYEMSGSQVKKYYSMAGMTIAMNDGSGANGLKYLLTDQLGSVVAMTDSTGNLLSQQRYLPFGGVRTDVSSPNSPATDFAFTGQRNIDAQGNAPLGLMDYNARMYDSLLARFIQPDTIIPSMASPQTWNRYAYVLNNPVNATDPTGHACNGFGRQGYAYHLCEQVYNNGWGNGSGNNNTTSAPNGPGAESSCLTLDCITGGLDFIGNVSISGIPSVTPQTSYFTVGTSPQANLFDPLKEFSILTGITPQSACAQILGSSASCNPDFYSINFSSFEFPTPTPEEAASGLDWTSQGLGFADAMHWVDGLHAPLIGIGLDIGVQSGEDSGKGYTWYQEVTRVGVHVFEGQASGWTATFAAGTASVPGAVTSVGDIAIMGGTYYATNALMSDMFSHANQGIVGYFPSSANYIPH